MSNATWDFKQWNSEERSKTEAGQMEKEMCAESHGFLFLPLTMRGTQEKEMKEPEINA